jgi:serine/threonine protein kinase
MSPELLAPDLLGLKNSRPTKSSDCYALGMVIYEVLSGQAPFAPFSQYVVMRKVMDGEHPEKPEGVEGAWFTDELWRMLNRCWATRPESRPSVAVVLECLERVSRDPEPPVLQVYDDLGADEGDWNFTNNSSRKSSWFNPRRFVALLRRILC